MKCVACPIKATYFYRWSSHGEAGHIFAKCKNHYLLTREMHRCDSHLMIELTEEEVTCIEVLES
jgi:hypothetical protein